MQYFLCVCGFTEEWQHLLVFLAMFVLAFYSPAMCGWEDLVARTLGMIEPQADSNKFT